MTLASEALEGLKAGNRRFVEGTSEARVDAVRREEVAEHQEPMAIVVGCADSRVPVEILFDQGVGDLFVIRVAGNIIAPSQLESVEFAAEHFGSRLVVVLGHSRCGAVKASLAELHKPEASALRSLRRVVNHIQPAVETLLAQEPESTSERILTAAVQANVEGSVRDLKASPALSALVADDGLEIVGAAYSLDTGLVEWL